MLKAFGPRSLTFIAGIFLSGVQQLRLFAALN